MRNKSCIYVSTPCVLTCSFILVLCGCDSQHTTDKDADVKTLQSQHNNAQAPKVSASADIESDSKNSPDEMYLPPEYASWQEFDKAQTAFRKKRVAAQDALPVNDDGSRVWLGQIVFADDALDARVKTHRMANEKVTSLQDCMFMTMDGTRYNFYEKKIGRAIQPLAVKKYVKIFGWCNTTNKTVKVKYITIGNASYTWNGNSFAAMK